MVEIQRGMGGASGSERLPWLEPVEDEDYGGRGSGEPGGYGGAIVTVIAVLIGITMVTAAIVWFRHHRAATADIGGVIKAPDGPYKVKPPESGGLRTDQVGEVASGTGAGQDIDGMLDLNAVPEQPMIQRNPTQSPQPAQSGQAAAPAQTQQPAEPKLAMASPPAHPAKAPAPAPIPSVVSPPPTAMMAVKSDAPPEPTKPLVTHGGTIQLGAFSSEAKAKTAWKTLSTRFAFLHDMNMALQPVKSGDNTLYRLRASGGPEGAGQLCGRLKIAGETCAVVGD